MVFRAGPQGLKSVRENSVVPPGLEFFFPLYPALKRWAKFGRPSGAGLSGISFHRVAQKRVLTHTLKPSFLLAGSGTAEAVPFPKPFMR